MFLELGYFQQKRY